MDTPDFDQIARERAKRRDVDDEDDMTADIAEQLRLVWNARGAADIAKVNNVLSEKGNAAPMVWLGPALRSLDR